MALPLRRSEWAGFALILALATALSATNLGNQYLWQDEAQTALIAQTILAHGVPLGYDGRNHFSQEQGAEYGEGYLWRWHTWLSFYLVAGSFALFGPTTWSARLPFALAGVATVALTFFTARRLWRDRLAAATAAGLLALSVPFLVLSRQCRYYSLAAFLSLLGLYAYAGMRPGRVGAPWLLFGAAALLFHTHYLYAASLLVSLFVHAALFERDRLVPLAAASLGVAATSLPWIVWLSGVELGREYRTRLLSPVESLRFAGRYAEITWAVFFARGGFLLAPLALAARRRIRGEAPWPSDRRNRSGVGLITIFCAVTVALLALLSPGVYVRYLTPLAAPLFALTGLLIAPLMRVWPAIGALGVATWVAVGPLADFVYELGHDYDGPIEGIVRFLERNAHPEDTVAMVYGDLPVKFYTGLRVVGGLTGEDLEAARGADWIILRHRDVAPANRAVRETLRGYLSEGPYVAYEIDYPDTAFENREDPLQHRFRSVERGRRVRIWGRRR